MKQFYAKYNKNLNSNAQKLRKNMTDQERKLSEGIEIIRFSNIEINKQFKSVCEYIDNEISKRI